GAAAQTVEGGRAGPREALPRAREVVLARSAAPEAVSTDATVLVWTGDDYEEAATGSNGVTCFVDRSWPDSLEPQCFDEEGSATILPIFLEQVRLRHRGLGDAEVDAAIAAGLRSGAFRLPARPAMSYMMSGAQVLFDDDGRRVGAWRPHLMIYYPYLTEEAMGLGVTPSLDAAMVVDPGTPLSNVLVVVRDFVQPEVEEAGGG
ncbi:MAG TPA: hypothetical protein VE173_11775, partial [Longimicrobiales bacterium]|nr:hypothetical protein [Longimicrobiales bacterium]